jgi:hypothetical protein
LGRVRSRHGVGQHGRAAFKGTAKGTALYGGSLVSGDRSGVRAIVSLQFSGPDKNKVQKIDLVRKGSVCLTR